MDYKNILLRFSTSTFLFITFLILVFYFENLISFLVLFIYLIIIYEILSFFKKSIKLIYLIFYLIFSFICFQSYIFFFYEKKIFLYFVFIVASFDTISYILGSLFGKKKILPNISPNKTILGFYLGLIFSLFFSIIINFYFDIFNLIESIIFSVLIIISTFFGDLIESFYKRISNIKNSSNLLPGHGGFFDRMDGFIMSIITLLLFSVFI